MVPQMAQVEWTLKNRHGDVVRVIVKQVPMVGGYPGGVRAGRVATAEIIAELQADAKPGDELYVTLNDNPPLRVPQFDSEVD